jgi:hypothetical protein
LRKKYSSHQALEARVQVGTERRQRVAAGAVEVRGVFLEAVVGRQVHAAAEPHHRRLAAGSAANMRTFMCTVGT